MTFNFVQLIISFDFNFVPLFVVIMAAWIVPIIMSILKVKQIPTVIIEIIAGYIIGRLIINPYFGDQLHELEFLALCGFLFLMFLSGLEIDVDQILISFPRRKLNISGYLKNPLLVGISMFIITLFLSVIGAYMLSFVIEVKRIWFFSLIMVTSSVGIILPVLKNRGELTNRFGQMIIIAAAIADILSVLLFSITAIILKNGFRFDLLLVPSIFLVFFIFYFVGVRISKSNLIKRLIYQLSHAASQIKVRSTILIILFFVVFAKYIGEEVVLLGAFLAGILLSLFLHKERSILILKLDGMGYGFFIPIFFIMVGIKFDPKVLFDLDESLYIFLLLLFITFYIVKVIPSFLWFRLFGIKRALSGGFLLAARLSLIIAISEIGLDLNIISESTNAAFVLMAVITCLLSPIIYSQIIPASPLIGNRVVIVGGSSIGVLLARRLNIHSKRSIIIENDKKRYNEIKSKGLNVVLGNGLDKNVYNKLKLLPNTHVIVLTGSDTRNLKISKLLRNDIQHENIITYSGNIDLEQKLKQLEVQFVDRTRALATVIENLILRPTTFHTLIETMEKFSVEEITITNNTLAGTRIKDLLLHPDGYIMLLKSKDKVLIPHGATTLSGGDLLTVFGSDTALADFRNKLA